MAKQAAVKLICVTLACCVAFARKHETGFLDRTVSTGGITYRYQVFLPGNFDRHKKWPIVLFRHGAGERGDNGLLQTDVGLGHAIRNSTGDLPFVVVMPPCRASLHWMDPSMQAQALAALFQSLKEFNGDRDRVYLTGLSMGGYGTWDLAAKYAGTFAAYVPICGGIRGPEKFPQLHVTLANDPKVTDPYAETARRIGKTPVWIFHGAEDSSVRTSGRQRALHRIPGVGHNSWDKAYAEPGLIEDLTAEAEKVDRISL